MTILWISILVVVALISFLGGFLMGINFAKAYLRDIVLPLEAPKPTGAKGCGKNDCGCG